jgi:hypothetical protein
MMQNFAYEIAAAFFLAAILMGGSFLRGFFSQEVLGAFKLAAAGLILAGAGLWIYRALPSGAAAATPVVQSEPGALKQAQKSRRAESLREADRKALAAAMAEEAAKPDVPAHIVVGGMDPPAAKEEAGNRGKRIAKSVGRALHIVPKPQP